MGNVCAPSDSSGFAFLCKYYTAFTKPTPGIRRIVKYFIENRLSTSIPAAVRDSAPYYDSIGKLNFSQDFVRSSSNDDM